jgi:activating signal cointegrator 1
MKAISLWQPWASAIALGAKTIETRSWATSYRGPLAIHAAKRCKKVELLHLAACWNWRGALNDILKGHPRDNLWDLLPFGSIVAICDLVDCRPTGSFTVAELDSPRSRPGGYDTWASDWTERGMGDFSLGRFGWVLKNIVALHEPVPCIGSRGLFNWERLHVPNDLEIRATVGCLGL